MTSGASDELEDVSVGVLRLLCSERTFPRGVETLTLIETSLGVPGVCVREYCST
jgi:hypothetical protein